MDAGLLWAGAGLALAGQIISLSHLGRLNLLLKAVLGLGRSWLSREVILSLVFMLLIAVSAILISYLPASVWLVALAAFSALLGLAAVFSVGMVYHLPGQLGWRGVAQVLAPPVATVYLASSVTAGWTAEPQQWVPYLFWTLFALDLVLSLVRYIKFLLLARFPHTIVFPQLKPIAIAVFWARIGLANFAAALFFMSTPSLIPLLVALGILLDRLFFYMGSAQATPEAEIRRINRERLIAAAACCRDGLNGERAVR